MALIDLFFGTDFFNRIGRKNIRGDELAALINAQGASANIGKGALVAFNGNFSVPNSLDQFVTWDTLIYDDLGFTDLGGANPERLVIPDVTPAIKRVIVGGGMANWAASIAGNVRALTPRYNFNAPGQPLFPAGTKHSSVPVPVASPGGLGQNFVTAPQPVSVGDQFTVGLFQDSGGALNVNDPLGWIMVVQ